MGRFLYALVLLCSCSEVLVPPDGVGGGGDGAGAPSPPATATQAASGETAGNGAGGTGGTGGHEPSRTIVVDLEVNEGTDANDIVVLVSAPDGTVSGTWLGGQLPVEAPVNDGDLVSYLYALEGDSGARTFRVTPEVTEVQVRSPLMAPRAPPCPLGEPMTMILDVPAVDGAGSYSYTFTTGVLETPIVSPVPGTIAREVRACPGITSFDVVLLAAEFSNTEPLTFARLEAIPYVPGTTTASLPVTWSTERLLVDFIVEAEPGTMFTARGAWQTRGLGLWGRFGVSSSLEQEVPESGTAMLSYGPFALGSGDSSVGVEISYPFPCGTERAWKHGPFDGTPLHAKIGVLAGVVPAADGNVNIAPDGEVGDVMVRTLEDYDNPLTHWQLNEDPSTPYPLPTPPDVPEALLPDFHWPSELASLVYAHVDWVSIEGYAEHAAGLNTTPADGRSRHGGAAGCP